MILALLVACLPPPEPPPPLVLAEDAGAGRWPANTVYAVIQAAHAGVAGIELDVGLTSDGIPVVATDAALGPACAGPGEGGPIAGFTLAELADWECGGVPDPDWPASERRADPVPTLARVAANLALVAPPDLVVELTLAAGDPDALAAASLDAWYGVDPPTPLVFASDDADRLAAIEVEGRSRGVDPSTVLVQDAEDPSPDPADGVGLPWSDAELREVERLADAGIAVTLIGLRDPLAAAGWPAEAVRTGYPPVAP